MIERIGVICQDANSLGFLKGLQDRLRCDAELIRLATAAVGKSQHLTTRQAKIAAAYFHNKGVDVVVRFTDADRDRWQDVKRQELEVFPSEVRSIVICGVAVDNPEAWLALDRQYLCRELGIHENELVDPRMATNKIKAGLRRIRRENEDASDVVARLVSQAPPDVFRQWLKDRSLRTFYEHCRRAALNADGDVPNELQVES